MKKEHIIIPEEDITIIDPPKYKKDVRSCFNNIPAVADSLIENADLIFNKIQQLLYKTPAIVNEIMAHFPEEELRVLLTADQKKKLADGTLKLMTKKDGSLMANLINPKTKKIIDTLDLQSIKVSPELSKAMIDYSSQMQMAQIAEQIQFIQIAVEEVRQGQENDRIATAYSCQQKFLQACEIKNPELKTMALMKIVSDAEDSRNLLMFSQMANLKFIKDQPENFWGKIIQGAKPGKIDTRMVEIRESLNAVNMVSLVEAMSYREMGELEVAHKSLAYYAQYLQKAYLSTDGFVERLDMIDPSTEKYWTKTLPMIEKEIKSLPESKVKLLKGEQNGRK